jgi:hypothetical protein
MGFNSTRALRGLAEDKNQEKQQMKTRKKGEKKTKTNSFGAIAVQMWCKWNSAVYLNHSKQYVC